MALILTIYLEVGEMYDYKASPRSSLNLSRAWLA